MSHYMREVFEHASQGRINPRSNFGRLKVSFQKSNMGQKNLSCSNPSV